MAEINELFQLEMKEQIPMLIIQRRMLAVIIVFWPSCCLHCRFFFVPCSFIALRKEKGDDFPNTIWKSSVIRKVALLCDNFYQTKKMLYNCS